MLMGGGGVFELAVVIRCYTNKTAFNSIKFTHIQLCSGKQIQLQYNNKIVAEKMMVSSSMILFLAFSIYNMT